MEGLKVLYREAIKERKKMIRNDPTLAEPPYIQELGKVRLAIYCKQKIYFCYNDVPNVKAMFERFQTFFFYGFSILK